MSNFTFNINGLLQDMKLAESKALWPLFEAVVNAIQAIEDSTNKDFGKITVFVHRENTRIDAGEMAKVSSERIESFTITDNGVGLDSKNYESFLSAYSTYKVQKGCKGIGRFLWLKAFDDVEISSVFCENSTYYQRNFTFSSKGVMPEENVSACEPKSIGTTVKLRGFKTRYKTHSPVELDVIATKLIEHCLLFFICGNCPQITLMDGVNDPINLNYYFTTNIKDSLHQDTFNIKEHSFTLYHLQVPEGANNHELHFCANMHEVRSVELKKYIPDLHNKIIPEDTLTPFYYAGYLTGEYLDSIVNTTRTAFDYDEKDAGISLYGTGEESLTSAAMAFVRGYLSDYIASIEKKKIDQINRFVSHDRPTYRYLLHKRPHVYKNIPAGLSNEVLELELHKQVQQWEMELLKKGQLLEQQSKNMLDQEDATYQQLFETYWAEVTELSKTSLAEYVTRRKTLLKMLEDALTIQDNGKFKKEDVIHTIICPMRHTSDDISFKEMNLWIIDERLAYHQFLASDKTIKSLPEVDSTSTKELDIAVFDRAFAYSDDEAPLNTITIIEFKKPDNTKDNPLSQMGGYIDEIVAGRKKRANGLTFGDCSKTAFRCFAVCDLTPKMVRHCKDAGLRVTPDGMGYYGYQPERNAYFEVISYNKLLSDAKKRNEILFDKLFKVQINEAVHTQEGKGI